MKKIFSFLIFATSLNLAKQQAQADVFFLPPTATKVGMVTQQKADQVALTLFMLHYSEVYKKTGQPLVLQSHWEDPYFGASAIRDETHGFISVFARGGLVRVPEMTENILALVFCHELGHVLGGEPYQNILGSEWTSVEGQADFFAASQCLPKYFQAQAKAAMTAADLQKKVLETSLQAVQFFQKYSPDQKVTVALEKSAPEVAKELNRNAYPSLQCRLDTFKAGASCLTEAICKAPACWLPQ